jgi:hypothetical protein
MASDEAGATTGVHRKPAGPSRQGRRPRCTCSRLLAKRVSAERAAPADERETPNYPWGNGRRGRCTRCDLWIWVQAGRGQLSTKYPSALVGMSDAGVARLRVEIGQRVGRRMRAASDKRWRPIRERASSYAWREVHNILAAADKLWNSSANETGWAWDASTQDEVCVTHERGERDVSLASSRRGRRALRLRSPTLALSSILAMVVGSFWEDAPAATCGAWWCRV